LVAYAVYNFPNFHTNQILRYLTNDWKIDTTYQIQTGLPYSASVSDSEGIAGDLNGAGGLGIIPQVGLNNYFMPRTQVDDLRLQKDLTYNERYHLELMGQVFNLANHQNATSLTTTAYSAEGCSTATLTCNLDFNYNGTFGQVTKTNNSGFAYAPRQIELSARLFF
jgi:hypothetical protein